MKMFELSLPDGVEAVAAPEADGLAVRLANSGATPEEALFRIEQGLDAVAWPLDRPDIPRS
ncbi:MAG: hypothetical protein R3175_11005 [Marinobacter sp.]|uniref:hypothetical protein n=1 Tax=Marinobacter sp. TaxID=50741 RepID=UPI00299D79D3|nr:hypothetical protein [Marinobacter sp.]MDX1756578.1 hypothetical protein [Marinobacter sp.]